MHSSEDLERSYIEYQKRVGTAWNDDAGLLRQEQRPLQGDG